MEIENINETINLNYVIYPKTNMAFNYNHIFSCIFLIEQKSSLYIRTTTHILTSYFFIFLPICQLTYEMEDIIYDFVFKSTVIGELFKVFLFLV